VSSEGPPSLGILGGTFNPPHLGHLALACQARDQLGLDRVALVPVHAPPHKRLEADPGAEHRLAMCRLAVGDAEGITACSIEIDRGGTSYTVDTVRALRAARGDAQLTLIMGTDAASTLPSWHEVHEVLAMTRLAVAVRGDAGRRQVIDAVASIGSGPQAGAPAKGAGASRGPAPGPVRFLEMRRVDVSSSLVRERAARGEPIEELVGRAVAEYILGHGLYRSSMPVAG
jgi:nicotinate-nucleotide adenylyltransferase